MDKFQNRYMQHQKRKAESLTSDFGVKVKPYKKKEQEIFFKIMENRCSQRVFNKEEMLPEDLLKIFSAIESAPSSCNRKGVETITILNRDKKDLLSGLLVGGVGWAYRGQVIFLLIANMDAYKNPAERDYMPYLDAGVLTQTIYLAAEALNYGACFVNPNIREENIDFFKKRFEIKENELFCGAVVVGKYELKHKK